MGPRERRGGGPDEVHPGRAIAIRAGAGLYGKAVDDFYTGDPDNPTHSYTAFCRGPVMLRLADNHGSEVTCTVYYVDVDMI